MKRRDKREAILRARDMMWTVRELKSKIDKEEIAIESYELRKKDSKRKLKKLKRELKQEYKKAGL